MLQWAMIGWPGKTGQDSLALSQTVMMISKRVLLNSSHDLPARVPRIDVVLLPQHSDGKRVDSTSWLAAGAVSFEAPFSKLLHEILGEDALGRIPCTKEKYFVGFCLAAMPTPYISVRPCLIHTSRHMKKLAMVN